MAGCAGQKADERYMRVALCQARKGLGTTSPNPVVGAVIVRQRQILSTGYHHEAGGPHAEIEAISRLESSEDAAGATLYVTLEPCSTYGKTPPCTEAIIGMKFSRVVIGAIDPNPQHQSRGCEQLRKAGIIVTPGILETECTQLNCGFNKWITTGMPWVIAKVAQSLDGRITRPPGEPRWLSNSRSQRLVQRFRSTVDAILVGAETLRRDDPQLTVRTIKRVVQPWRVVVTRSGNLPGKARMFLDEFADRTIVYRNRDWKNILVDLGKKGVTRLLIEGGGQVLGQLLDEGRIDEVWCFIAPLLTGGDTPSFGGRGIPKSSDAFSLDPVCYKRIGNDVLITGRVCHR
jgi:diaminohydroxyphosphoribosylaminopyrimidine deaminase/5-amino-6-(5-phosphoribosylamino)uracil reductase